MIVRARVVVTMDGPPIEDGGVAISHDRIIDAGRFADVEKRNRGQILDLGEQALLPGLINAHCHLDYTCLRGKIPPQDTFTDWIRAINAEKAKLLAHDYLISIREGLAEAKRFGTTSMVNLTAFPELISQIEPLIRMWWFAELIDVREPERARAIVEAAVQALKAEEHWGLAPHAPFTASASLYRHCQGSASLLATHLAESPEEMAMFRDASGPLYQFLKDFGRDMSDCGGATPLSRFLTAGSSSTPPGSERNDREWMLIHLNELGQNDFDLLERSADRFHIVHCPRSHTYFGHSPFPFTQLRKLGLNICLGTDSLASNQDLSLFAEMRTFQKNEPHIRPEEILSMATVNPVRALGKKLLGRIRRNYLADMIAIPFTGPGENLFDEIVAFHGHVISSTINGETSGAS
jgi:aminodeoxyfutalosine deaminase